jgi:RNA polymerase sigma factor (sigma-70 family)
MFGVCMRYSKDKDEAKDILQEGFLKVFINLKKYEGSGSFEGWVRRLITNNAIDTIRKRDKKTVRLTQYEDDDDFTIETPSDDYLEGEEIVYTKEQIMDGVNGLSPQYRLVFNMHVIDELSHEEVAKRLGISIGTSKSNLSKAKAKLRGKLITKKI